MRIKGSGIQFNNGLVRELASKGKSIAEIAAAVGSNVNTFKRRKREDGILNAAYAAGLLDFASARGNAVRKMDDGSLRVLPVESTFQSRTDLVLDYLKANTTASGFHDIRKGTMLSSDEVSDALAYLVLDTGLVRTSTAGDGNRRYHVNQLPNANNHRFNQRQPAGILNGETRWQAAY